MNISRLTQESAHATGTTVTGGPASRGALTMSCDRCELKPGDCDGCLVGLLLEDDRTHLVEQQSAVDSVAELHRAGMRLDEVHLRAIDVLADAGLIARDTAPSVSDRGARRSSIRTRETHSRRIAG